MNSTEKEKRKLFYRKIKTVAEVFEIESMDQDFNPQERLAIKEIVRNLNYILTLQGN